MAYGTANGKAVADRPASSFPSKRLCEHDESRIVVVRGKTMNQSQTVTRQQARRLARGGLSPSLSDAHFPRREFLRLLSFAGAGSVLPRIDAAPGHGSKPLRGIFPIVQTPYTDAGKVDFATLEKEVKFAGRTGVHGIVWPQLASQYFLLSFEERIRGAEAIVGAGKALKPAVVIGVQASDTATAVKFAKHADKLKPDAIIALPTKRGDDLDLNEAKKYYAAIADACGLPFFVQTTGNMSVEFVMQMAREIPTLRFIKDEAGHTLSRITEFRAQAGDMELSVFTGGHGRTLIDEMMRGSGGCMPAVSWVDLYVKVWDAWHAGKKNEALDMFSKVMLFVTQARSYGLPGLHYVLHLRGVFPNWKVRGEHRPLDDYAKKSLKQNLDFVKPHLVA